MKKMTLAALAVVLLVALSACGSDQAQNAQTPDAAVEAPAEAPVQTPAETPAAATIGAAYLNAFNASSATGADAAADEMIALGAFESELVKMEVSEGYLDGFTEDISGFSTGVKFSPMIGSIPFVGYVFESDDPDALLAKLTETADPAWNICTEADETVSAVRGNLVFFLMCSNE